MGGWQQMMHLVTGFIDQYDEWAIPLLIFVEECGLPLPLPGDMIMMMAGYRVARGEMNLALVLVLLEAATLAGASILYWLAAHGGRPLLHHYGRYLHLDEPKLERAEAWLQRRGLLAVLLGRFIPGLRIATPLAAGAFGVPYPTFLLALGVGSFGYILTFVLLGLWLGPRAIDLLEGLHLPLRVILTGVSFVALGGVLLLLYRRANSHGQLRAQVRAQALRETAPPETAILAGFLATIEMGLGVNLLLYLLSALDLLGPEAALLGFVGQAAPRVAGGSLPRLVILLVGLVCLVNVATALVYTRVGIRHLPGDPWLEGLLVAVLPFLLWVLVLLPAFGAGVLGLGLGAGWWPLAGEALRNALFGLGLGVSHALLSQARRPAAAATAQ